MTRIVRGLLNVSIGLVTWLAGAGAGWALSATYDQTMTTDRDTLQSKVSVRDEQFRIEMTQDGQTAVLIRDENGQLYQYLVEQGVAMQQIYQTSFGEDHPVSENKTREGRAQNRAVVMRVMAPGTGGSSNAMVSDAAPMTR